MKNSFLLLFSLLVSPLAAWATDTPTIADTYISSANPSLNFGNLPSLTVGSGSTALVQFDLSSLPQGVTSANILKATLTVFVDRVGTSGTMEISPVESPWTESAVTYSTAPAIGVPIGNGVAVSGASAYVTYDITAQVQAWVANPNTNFGLALSSSGSFYLDSKEATTTSHPASLDISLSVAPTGDLFVQTSGYLNVAAGPDAMPVDTGSYNTAFGAQTLQVANQGPYNTGIGFQALQNTTTGAVNTAVGANALWDNTTGSWNDAFGASALQQNTTGQYNTGIGFYALAGVKSGSFNTALGTYAGWGVVNNVQTGPSGSDNILIGVYTGSQTTTGSWNIEIGNQGASTDSNLIRIGDYNQTRTFISGIRGVGTGVGNAVEVVIDGNGQLGTINSSRDFKKDIADMGDASDGLMKLRPVIFHYKQPSADGVERLEYGLIAEEVADIYPDAVAYTPDGKVETVQYHKINAMMLNEIQKQQRTIVEQSEELKELKTRFAAIEKKLQAGDPEAH